MDRAEILNALQNAIPAGIWYLIPLSILALIIKSLRLKGGAGEGLVNLSTKLFLDKMRYNLIKSVTQPTEDDATQIDHVVVVGSDVFVVKTRNSMGWIFGSKKLRYLTKKILKHFLKFQRRLTKLGHAGCRVGFQVGLIGRLDHNKIVSGLYYKRTSSLTCSIF